MIIIVWMEKKCVIIIHIFWLVPFLFCYTQPIYYWWNKNEGRNRHKKNKYERRRNERLRKKPKEESNIKSIRQPPCNFLMLFDLLQLTAIITFWRPFLWSFLSLLFLLYDSINFFSVFCCRNVAAIRCELSQHLIKHLRLEKLFFYFFSSHSHVQINEAKIDIFF